MSPGVPSGGKSSTTDARYRYVLQLSVIGPEGTLFPLMHEEMDLHNPQTQKEDCELKSFQRLSQRLKKEFPRLPICSVPDARSPYVLQLSVIGPEGTLFPLMHEEMDLHNPQTQKEDCELQSFQRLSQRLKKEFPKLPICLVADALYACQAIVEVCQRCDWKYVLTLKEGRQPTTWEETIKLLPFHRTNRARHRLGAGGKAGLQDFRWVENVLLGAFQTNVILSGEITPEAATLYAYITNFSKLSPERVAIVVNRGGRERHLIEDTFNTQKNNGIGLEHVFCAQATASKNYYAMMQVAQILWILTCRGSLQRLYDWARRATEQGLACALWEGLRAARLPPDLPPLGQIRFGFA